MRSRRLRGKCRGQRRGQNSRPAINHVTPPALCRRRFGWPGREHIAMLEPQQPRHADRQTEDGLDDAWRQDGGGSWGG